MSTLQCSHVHYSVNLFTKFRELGIGKYGLNQIRQIKPMERKENTKKKKVEVNLNLNVRGLSKSATLWINEASQQLQKEGKEIFRLGLGQSPFPRAEISNRSS